MNYYPPEPEPTAEEYCAGYGHPFYATHPEGWGSCYCGQRTYPAQMDAFERKLFLALLDADVRSPASYLRVLPAPIAPPTYFYTLRGYWRDGARVDSFLGVFKVAAMEATS